MSDGRVVAFESRRRSGEGSIQEGANVAVEDARNSLQPEKKLMLSVLLDAARAVQKHIRAAHRSGKRPLSEAERWFAADNTDWPFSFVNICEALGLNASRVRSGLAAWRERQEAARVASPRSATKQCQSYCCRGVEAGLFRWSL